jgi:DNA mismatch endonuclease (patch repair protein)
MADNMSVADRSRTMSRIRSKNTKPELLVRRRLFGLGFRYRLHDRRLPGCPDLIFPTARVVVFIDGDFWHGWRFRSWSQKLEPYWRSKIERNRRRDVANFRKLRRRGWIVIRLWEHEVKRNADACVTRVAKTVAHYTAEAGCRGRSR